MNVKGITPIIPVGERWHYDNYRFTQVKKKTTREQESDWGEVSKKVLINGLPPVFISPGQTTTTTPVLLNCYVVFFGWGGVSKKVQVFLVEHDDTCMTTGLHFSYPNYKSTNHQSYPYLLLLDCLFREGGMFRNIFFYLENHQLSFSLKK